MAWLAGWDQRVKLTIDNTDVDAALSDFPVLVYLSTSSGRNSTDVSFVFDELTADANRKKIAVTTSDGETECYVEIERWDDANEHAWLWVKAPSISNSADTELYLYYDVDHADNDAHVGDTNSVVAENVWDANFKCVYHMRDGVDTSHVYDSTSNDNDGTKGPWGQKPTSWANGKIDDAQDFDGNDYIIIPFELAPDYTVEFWACPDNIADADGTVILAFGDTTSGGSGVAMGFYTGTDEILIGNDAFQFGLDDISAYLTNGVWQYWVDVVDANNDIDFYLDGTLKVLDATTYWTNIAGARFVGVRSTPAYSRYLDGKVDEVRISDSLRSAEWIKASYESERDHLLDWGTEESPGQPYISRVQRVAGMRTWGGNG